MRYTNICPTQPLPPPRVTSLYEADTPLVPHVDMDALLQSSARASKHILGTALGLFTDILLVRRDLAASTSSVLGPGRDALRTAPLGYETLFDGRCLEFSASDLQDRQRRHLAQGVLDGSAKDFEGRGFGLYAPHLQV